MSSSLASVAALLFCLPPQAIGQLGAASWQQLQQPMLQQQQPAFGPQATLGQSSFPQMPMQSLQPQPFQQYLQRPATPAQQLSAAAPAPNGGNLSPSMRFQEVQEVEPASAVGTSVRPVASQNDIAVRDGSFLPPSPLDNDEDPEDVVGEDARFMEARHEGDPGLAVADKIAQEARFAGVDLLSKTSEDEESDKLAQPLREVKQDIIEKAKQIKQENAWIEQVATVISSYEKKVGNVKGNVLQLRKEVRDLLRKKRQIQNLVLQQELQKKLDDASADMGTIENALNHVKSKADNFQRTRNNLKETVASLQKALSGLKGKTDEEEEEGET